MVQYSFVGFDRSISLIKSTASVAYRRVRLSVGFGIPKPSHVRRVINCGADRAIVGSRFVKIIEENLNDEERMLVELKNCAHGLEEATGKDQNRI